jgi:hypothetical protein
VSDPSDGPDEAAPEEAESEPFTAPLAEEALEASLEASPEDIEVAIKKLPRTSTNVTPLLAIFPDASEEGLTETLYFFDGDVRRAAEYLLANPPVNAAAVGPRTYRYCSPRHRMPVNLRDEG